MDYSEGQRVIRLSGLPEVLRRHDGPVRVIDLTSRMKPQHQTRRQYQTPSPIERPMLSHRTSATSSNNSVPLHFQKQSVSQQCCQRTSEPPAFHQQMPTSAPISSSRQRQHHRTTTSIAPSSSGFVAYERPVAIQPLAESHTNHPVRPRTIHESTETFQNLRQQADTFETHQSNVDMQSTRVAHKERKQAPTHSPTKYENEKLQLHIQYLEGGVLQLTQELNYVKKVLAQQQSESPPQKVPQPQPQPQPQPKPPQPRLAQPEPQMDDDPLADMSMASLEYLQKKRLA